MNLIQYVPKSSPTYVVNRNVKLKDRGRLTRFTSISNIAYNETKAACQVKKRRISQFHILIPCVRIVLLCFVYVNCTEYCVDSVTNVIFLNDKI